LPSPSKRAGSLRAGLSLRKAADIIWTLASERVHLDLVTFRVWCQHDFEQWLVEQLTAALLSS
jgi:hypothetical protein